MSPGEYRRWAPEVCTLGPSPYRRSQVRSVAGATPSRRATAATVSMASGESAAGDSEGMLHILEPTGQTRHRARRDPRPIRAVRRSESRRAVGNNSLERGS